MTLVRVDSRRPNGAGEVGAGGDLVWQPTRRRTQDEYVVMPAAFGSKLTDGVAVVDVAPTGVDWCWEVTEKVPGGTTRYVAVPDVDEIAYTDLIDVDPATLDPAATPVAAWWAVAESMVVSGVEAVEAAGVATAAADTAVGVADALPAQASSAVAAEVVARVDPKVVAAAGSAMASAGSATQAVQAKTAAEAARDRAEAVPTTSDGIMTSVAADPETEFAAQLKATIGDLVDPVAVDVVAAQVVTQIDPKVTTAQDAATTATTKAGEAAASATTAQQWATGFSAGTATPLAAGAAPTLAINGPAGAKVLDLGIPAGAKGDPGGWVNGTVLGDVSLDTIITPGLYRTVSPAFATTANKYPITGANGTCSLEVQLQSTGAILQRFNPIFGVASGKIIFQRTLFSGAWSAWQAFNSTRTSQAAGRAIYQWDELNNREQLVYGDTGTRDISLQVVAGTISGGVIEISREMHAVVLQLRGVQLSISGTVEIMPPSTLIGFEPSTKMPDIRGVLVTAAGQARMVAVSSTGQITIYAAVAGDTLSGTVGYRTAKNWPTTLPGNASGTIPNL